VLKSPKSSSIFFELMDNIIWKLYKKSAACLLRMFKLTMRFEVHNQPQQEPVLYAFWHRNLIYCCLQRAGDPIAVLVSASKDGDLLAGPVEELGFTTVRGSSSRQGSQALKEMLRHARKYSVGITPDGPRGPVGTIHPGMFHIAQLANIPIVAVACDADREWVFNSWDRFRFPKPFARVKVEYSDPIWVHNKADVQKAELDFRSFIQESENRFHYCKPINQKVGGRKSAQSSRTKEGMSSK